MSRRHKFTTPQNLHSKGMALVIKTDTPLGTIAITHDCFASLVGTAVQECYGVVGMSTSNPTQDIFSLVSKQKRLSKGVKVRSYGGKLIIDLHIKVSYGLNISAIVKSIVHKVKYTIEASTGFPVASVNVFVDSMSANL